MEAFKISKEDFVLESLSKGEQKVFSYIKNEAEKSENGKLQRSMSKIGADISLSEATVHRAIRRLRTLGVVGIIPSVDKTESNEIVFYGAEISEDKQIDNIFSMASQLSTNIERVKLLLDSKTESVEKLKKENEDLTKELILLKSFLEKLEKSTPEKNLKIFFEENDFAGFTDLGDGNSALVFKKI